MELIEALEEYQPWNEQEERDRAELLRRLKSGEELYSRENLSAHLTASAWVVSPDRQRVLLAYHNLYDSWACRRRPGPAGSGPAGDDGGERTDRGTARDARHLLRGDLDGGRP